MEKPIQALAVIEKPEPWEPNYTALSMVASDQLYRDTTSIEDQPQLIEEYKRRKLPIYLDAIKRGMRKISPDLHTQGLSFDVMDGNAKRVYKIVNGELSWRLLASSDDTFAKIRFFKDVKEKGIPHEGTTTFDEDPFLIEEALARGMNEHSQLYGQFQQTVDTIQRVKSLNRADTYLPSFIADFNDITRTSSALVKEATDNPAWSEKDLFIERVVNGTIKPREVEKQGVLAKDAAKLLTLFYDKTKPFTPDQLQQVQLSERSFVVELFTHPASLQTVNRAQKPTTEYERILAFNRFLADRLHYGDTIDSRVDISFAISYALDKNKLILAGLCEQLGVDEKIGMEYFRHMVSTRIFRDIEEVPSFIGIAQQEKPDLHLYNNSFNIGRKQYIKFEKRHASPDEPLKQIDVQKYADALIRRNIFLKGSFDPLNLPNKKLILDRIFQKKSEGGMRASGIHIEKPTQVRDAITILLNAYNFGYSPALKRFTAPLPSTTDNIDRNKKFLDSHAAILQKIHDLIDENNPAAIDTMEKMIMKNTIQIQAKTDKWPTDQVRLVGAYQFDRVRQTTQEEDLALVHDACVNMVLSLVAGAYPKSAPLDQLVSDATNATVSYLTSTNQQRAEAYQADIKDERRQRTRKTPLQPPTPLPQPTFTELKTEILRKVKEKYTRIAQGEFPPDYNNNKGAFLQSLLQRSIEGIQSRNFY